jgi:hypothetical protein
MQVKGFTPFFVKFSIVHCFHLETGARLYLPDACMAYTSSVVCVKLASCLHLLACQRIESCASYRDLHLSSMHSPNYLKEFS